jgi:hypothetical protein
VEHFQSLARELTLPNLIGTGVIFVVALGRSAIRMRSRDR